MRTSIADEAGFATLTQRRDGDGEGAEAVEEILAEALVRHGCFHVDVGCGQDPDIYLGGVARAEPGECAVLQNVQQLRLHLRAHLADLVQQKGALIGKLELAGLGANGTGKCADFVSEELTLEQLGRECGAVHVDKVLATSAMVLMQQHGDDFFADAAFAEYQNGNIDRCKDANILINVQHCWTRSKKEAAILQLFHMMIGDSQGSRILRYRRLLFHLCDQFLQVLAQKRLVENRMRTPALRIALPGVVAHLRENRDAAAAKIALPLCREQGSRIAAAGRVEQQKIWFRFGTDIGSRFRGSRSAYQGMPLRLQ